MSGPAGRVLPDGRLHLQHGPIDLIVGADGDPACVRAAYGAAVGRFPDILPALCDELPLLRRAVTADSAEPDGPVARRMTAACRRHAPLFVTPMAAVAGAVADEVLAVMTAAAPLERAYVNNGGDAALHLAPGRTLNVGIAEPRDGAVALDGTLAVAHDWPVRGVATSGWRGRSLSFGIADAVTVLAADAAAADAAATLVANAVTVSHPAIRRLPASSVRDDSDLGDRPVTVEVGPLPPVCIAAALANGRTAAERMRADGTIWAAVLRLDGFAVAVGPRSALGGQGEGRRAA